MVFSSVLFLFRFFPVTFAVYYLTPAKFKNLVLLIASLIFYSWGEARYFPIMAATILVDYLAGLWIERNRGKRRLCQLGLAVAMCFNLGTLFYFKYANFFLSNINGIFGTNFSAHQLTLPLGISFYTFQIMSYVIDVYFEKVEAERNFINFGAYVVLFPQLIAGPIVKYTDVNKELQSRTITAQQMQEGVKLFIFGLASKVLIANNVGYLWTELQELGFANISTPLAWMGIVAYSFQIYFDFSGYSLMAIGLGKMLGFQFPKNFDFPYISRSMTEFWRRWHMTLGSWFREYLYIPLGGNRVSTPRLYFNLFVVWAATGLWHGASWNFVFWGLMFFVLLAIEKAGFKRFLDKHRIFSHCYVIILLIFSWALFALSDFSVLTLFISRLFAFAPGSDWQYYLRNYAVIFVIAAVFSTPLLKGLYQKWEKNSVFSMVLFGGLLLVCVAYMVDSSYSPFLYFNF